MHSREDIELNILNCYDSSHAFLMNFKFFKYTTYVMYIEIVLIVIIIVLCILIPFVQKSRDPRKHIAPNLGFILFSS